MCIPIWHPAIAHLFSCKTPVVTSMFTVQFPQQDKCNMYSQPIPLSILSESKMPKQKELKCSKTQTGPKSLTLCLLYVQQVVQSRAADNVQVISSLPA